MILEDYSIRLMKLGVSEFDSKVYTDFLSDLEEIYDNNDNLRNDDHNPLNHLFTHDELSKAIARAKKGKTTGIDE